MTPRSQRAMAALVGGLLVLGPSVAIDAQQASDQPTLTVPVAPVRILDTRTGVGTGGLTTPIGPNSEIELTVAGVESVPAGAVGVVLNMTATEGSEPSFLTVYPSGTGRPNASVLNIAPESNLPNMITAKLGDGGRLRIYNLAGTVHVLADVAGYLIPTELGGVPGPAGPQGPAGPPGQPGTATAWGKVSGTGTPSFVVRSANVTSVIREPGWIAGAWCITFSPEIPIERLVAATVSVGTPNEVVFNLTQPDGIACSGLRIHARQPGTNNPLNTTFTFAVP